MPSRPTMPQLEARYARTYRRIMRARTELTLAEDAMARILATAIGHPNPDAMRNAVIDEGMGPRYRTLSDAMAELTQTFTEQ